MSCFVLFIRGRTEEDQLSDAAKAAARRMAMCVSAFSPPLSDAISTRLDFTCAYEFNQLSGGLRGKTVLHASQSPGRRKASAGEEPAEESGYDDGSTGLSRAHQGTMGNCAA